MTKMEQKISEALMATWNETDSHKARYIYLSIKDVVSQCATVSICHDETARELWNRVFPDHQIKSGRVPTRVEGRTIYFEFECDSVKIGNHCALLEVAVDVEAGGWVINYVKNVDANDSRVDWEKFSVFDQGRLQSRTDSVIAEYQGRGLL